VRGSAQRTGGGQLTLYQSHHHPSFTQLHVSLFSVGALGQGGGWGLGIRDLMCFFEKRQAFFLEYKHFPRFLSFFSFCMMRMPHNLIRNGHRLIMRHSSPPSIVYIRCFKKTPGRESSGAICCRLLPAKQQAALLLEEGRLLPLSHLPFVDVGHPRPGFFLRSVMPPFWRGSPTV